MFFKCVRTLKDKKRLGACARLQKREGPENLNAVSHPGLAVFV